MSPLHAVCFLRVLKVTTQSATSVSAASPAFFSFSAACHSAQYFSSTGSAEATLSDACAACANPPFAECA
eukprot:3953111-Pleurochrysis_carterae.AAC.1